MDEQFQHRGLKFHKRSFEARRKKLWYVFVSAYENIKSHHKPTEADPGRFGMTRPGEFGSAEEAAEAALERLNRRLIDDGECPIEFAGGTDIVSAAREQFAI